MKRIIKDLGISVLTIGGLIAYLFTIDKLVKNKNKDE